MTGMTDTNELMRAKYRSMLMKRKPADRLKMGCSMFDLAKKFVTSSIRSQNPHSSMKEMKREIFLRFYDRDFDPIQKQKILNALK